MLAALSCIVASACVLNNIQDKDIDARMSRTKNRAMVAGSIDVAWAYIFGFLLLLAGCGLFIAFGTLTSLLVAIFGWSIYVFVYTPAKKRTVYASLIGSLAGATPPVIGYTWVSASLDAAAAILFLILALWQMPHFYSIAIYHLDDYKSAKIPVLPLQKGVLFTKINILFFLISFGLASILLKAKGYTGDIYLILTCALIGWWLWLAIKGFSAKNDKKWARRMFIRSLFVITIISLLITFDHWLK